MAIKVAVLWIRFRKDTMLFVEAGPVKVSI
jgi:hypothetical protein